ncbi:MAG: hypothetical protein CW716_00545 [Candidatus Bathyarchaeum sp.]|nr:MAG: hypothetical protein CW716_00545 [Candidatus Bathyarchaeum sp.]
MLGRRVVVVLAVSIICFVLVAGTLVFCSWQGEQVLENLKGFSARLEDDGFVVEAKVLSEFKSDSQREWEFFGDFQSYAKQSSVTTVYYDQSIGALFYLAPVSSASDEAEVNTFYYSKLF